MLEGRHGVGVEAEVEIFVAPKKLGEEVVEVFAGDVFATVAGAGHPLVVVLFDEGGHKLDPALEGSVAAASPPVQKGLGELGLDKTDEPLGEKRLVAPPQEVPPDLVVSHQERAKGVRRGNGVSVGVDGGHLPRLLDKFGDGIQPLGRVLAASGQHKESAGDVFHGHEKTRGPAVGTGPVLVKLSVVDKVDAGPERRDGLVVLDFFRPGKRSQVGGNGFPQKLVNALPADSPQAFGIGPVEQLRSRKRQASVVENFVIVSRNAVHGCCCFRR